MIEAMLDVRMRSTTSAASSTTSAARFLRRAVALTAAAVSLTVLAYLYFKRAEREFADVI